MVVPEPLALAIEISNPTTPPGGALALARIAADGKLLDPLTEPIALPTREQDDLTPALDRLLRRAGVAPARIERVVVSIGPGGYTALRMAVATAKMIAWSNSVAAGGNGCLVVAVPTALVAAESAEHAGLSGPLAVALAGKADAAFVTIFPPDWRRSIASLTGRLTGPADLPPGRGGTLLADSHLPEALRSAAIAGGWTIRPPVLDPLALLRISLLLEPTPMDDLVPLYGREPEAVTLWRKRPVA